MIFSVTFVCVLQFFSFFSVHPGLVQCARLQLLEYPALEAGFVRIMVTVWVGVLWARPFCDRGPWAMVAGKGPLGTHRQCVNATWDLPVRSVFPEVCKMAVILWAVFRYFYVSHFINIPKSFTQLEITLKEWHFFMHHLEIAFQIV